MHFRGVLKVSVLAPLLTGVLLTSIEASAGERSEHLEAAAGERSSELGDVAFPSPVALCKTYVAQAKQTLAAGPPSWDESIVPHAPRCTVEAKPLPFAGTRTWKSLRVAHLDDGIGRGSELVVETPAGFVLAPIGWGWDDPRDPGCPSIVRAISIHGAAVQHGRLVVVMAGERTTYVEPVSEDDPGARAELVRIPFWASVEGGPSGPAGGKVSFRSTDSFMTGGTLGSKVQPGRTRSQWVEWASLPWSGLRSFQLDAQGAIQVVPEDPFEKPEDG